MLQPYLVHHTWQKQTGAELQPCKIVFSNFFTHSSVYFEPTSEKTSTRSLKTIIHQRKQYRYVQNMHHKKLEAPVVVQSRSRTIEMLSFGATVTDSTWQRLKFYLRVRTDSMLTSRPLFRIMERSSRISVHTMKIRVNTDKSVLVGGTASAKALCHVWTLTNCETSECHYKGHHTPKRL